MDKLFGALSLSRKAGKLAAGFDAVRESAAKGEARLLLFASDVSPGTRRRAQSGFEAVPARDLPFAQAEVAAITRKPVGVLAITDEGLAALCLKALEAPPSP